MWTPPEIFHSAYSYATSALSFLANVLLIRLIIKNSPSYIGSYRHLLVAFAVSDIVLSIITAVVLPVIHATPFGYIAFGYNLVHLDETIGVILLVAYSMVYTLSFILVSYRFLYRFNILRRPHLFHFTKNWHFCTWVALGIVGVVLCLVGDAMCLKSFIPDLKARSRFSDVVKEVYGFDLNSSFGYLAIIYSENDDSGVPRVRLPAIISTVCGCIFMYLSFALMIFCSFKIYRRIKSPFLDQQIRRHHSRLFTALAVQALIRTILGWFPLSVLFFIPFTGLDLGGWSNVFVLVGEILPVLDPVFTICFVASYRGAVRRFVRKAIRIAFAFSVFGLSSVHPSPSMIS